MNKQTLRPLNFNEFIGQEKLKITLKTMISGALHRKEAIDHILFYGPPGVGKTTLATILAQELNVKIHYLQGSLLEKKSDILSVFANVNNNDIVFIDEVHSVNNNIEELIYNAMEDFKIDLIIGPEGNSKVLRMNLKPFTLIAATTKPNLISQPFKDRFGFKAKLNPYSQEDIIKILQNNQQKLEITVEQGVLDLIARYSRNTPRVANHLLKRVFDFSIIEKEEYITKQTVRKTFQHLDLYDLGLNRDHIDYLMTLNEVFETKYASLESLAGILNFPKDSLIYEIEPLLLNLKLIRKSPRGRTITTKGIDYLINQNV
ncbi:Holliday junction branch migration DNA helicase RuvB [Mycoplasmopsis iners]|uniref:Holliday junction branch migration DNA helicase RuvB n=1 Tax=Mycoplasmopsis iners TaxID=76630 RepID=UPI00049662F9|nr:Holliday junction branch migration DNA helicase RuvB [Mycoplasmopsis iners]